uniref:Uncharacterized protein n=1 Tax=Abalone asfa-like virus TaxID=2839893 RepID=A0A5K7XYK4_9VIRU|nr:hypothetical protein [Abalone asfa-like virus]
MRKLALTNIGGVNWVTVNPLYFEGAQFRDPIIGHSKENIRYWAVEHDGLLHILFDKKLVAEMITIFIYGDVTYAFAECEDFCIGYIDVEPYKLISPPNLLTYNLDDRLNDHLNLTDDVIHQFRQKYGILEDKISTDQNID